MALIDSFFIPDYVEMSSGLTSPSELFSEIVTVTDLSSQPVNVTFNTGTIVKNGIDVGNSASFNNGDTIQLKVTNPTIDQTSVYNYTVAGAIAMEWHVSLFNTASLPTEVSSTLSTDSESYEQVRETLPVVIVQVEVPEDQVAASQLSQEPAPETEVADTLPSTETIADVAAKIKTSLIESITQSVKAVVAESESDLISTRDISDLFDNQTRVTELTELISTEALAEIIETSLVEEEIKTAILSDDVLRDFVKDLPEQIIDNIVSEFKETAINEIADIIETKQSVFIEELEKAAVNVLDSFIDREVLSIIEKLVTEETDIVELGNLEKEELTLVEQTFGQFFFEELEKSNINEINLNELTVREFLLDTNIGEFVEELVGQELIKTEDSLREELQKQVLEFLKQDEELLEKTIVAEVLVEELREKNLTEEDLINELKQLDLITPDIIEELNRLTTDESIEVLERLVREFATTLPNISTDELEDVVLTPNLDSSDLIDSTISTTINEEDATDEVATPSVGQDDTTDDTVTPNVGQDDTTDDAITTNLGQDDTTDDTVTPNVGQDDTTDDTVTPNVGQDDREEESIIGNVGEDNLGEQGIGSDDSLVGGGISKGVIRLHGGTLTYYHLRPVTILGEITGLNSVIGPFIDRNGINRSMKL